MFSFLLRNQKLFSTMATSSSTTRVFAISDLHVDMRENLKYVENWAGDLYQNDVLIVGGDLTDNIPLLKSTLQCIQSKFYKVFYVPGNHELWIRRDAHSDSIQKFHSIVEMCAEIGVCTDPANVKINSAESSNVWIVPLFSWCAKPEDDLEDSLYSPGTRHLKEDRELSEQVWMDNHLCKWDSLPQGLTAAKYFAAINNDRISRSYDAPIISFSHFVPRIELVRQDDSDLAEVNKYRMRHHLGQAPKLQGGLSGFNFTRYAGSKSLETAIRKLGSRIHVYGHQHRNRDREVEGVRYVSHCLGNVREQREGWTWGLEEWKGPKQIWPEGDAFNSL